MLYSNDSESIQVDYFFLYTFSLQFVSDRISQYEQPGPNNYPLKCLTLKYIGTTPPDGIPLDVEDCLNSKEPNSVYQQFYFSPKDTWPGPLVL